MYKDKLNRTIQIDVPLKRAVVFLTYELIPALDCWEKVVGIGRWAYENDLVLASKPNIRKEIPSVGTGTDINIESLIKLKPEIVITWTHKPDQIHFLGKKGFNVVAIYPESLLELFEVIRFHGQIFGKEDRALRVISKMRETFYEINEKSKKVRRKKKVLWMGSRPTSVAGEIGITHELFELMNARNVAGEIRDRNRDVSIEKIVAWDPEVIFIWGNAKYKASDILRDIKFKTIKAVQFGQVFKLPDWSTWSPRLAPIALWMATKTYPECFDETKLKLMLEEYFESIFNIPYNKVRQIED
jgi:iron complex transport system substrate-binding protein